MNKTIIRFGLIILASVCMAGPSLAAPTLSGGSVSGNAGTDVDLAINFNPSPNQVASLQFSLTLPASVSTVSVTAGIAATNAGKQVSANKVGNSWNFIIFGLNTTSIDAGLVTTARLHIASNASAGALTIPLVNAVYADANGASISGGTSTQGTVTVTAAPPPPPAAPSVTSNQTASGTAGTAFSYQITASNSPTSFNATGLPSGLSINTTSGLISGTPTAAGTSSITLSATNAGGTGTRTLTLTVSAAPSTTNPTLSGGSTSGNTGTTVTLPITFSPGSTGVASLQFTVGLPSGWSFISFSTGAASQAAGKSVSGNTSNGSVLVFGLNQTVLGSGIVAQVQMSVPAGASAGSYPVTLTAASFSDANGTSVTGGTSTSGSITVTTAPPPPPSAPSVTSSQNATGTVGTAFSYQITASNSPTSFNAAGLPAGLSINTTTGLISGTPTAAGTSSITLSATNAGGTGTRLLTLTVSPATSTNPSLNGGSTSGNAGSTVILPISFFAGSTGVSSLQFTVGLPSGWTFVSFSTGAASQAAGKSVSGNPSNGSVLVFGLNQTVLGSGVVARVQVNIPSNATTGNYPITVSAASYSDANGNVVSGATPTNGSVSVTGSGNPGPTGLPAPVLNLPSTLPLDAEVQLTNAGSYSGASFTWNVTPVPNSVIGFNGSAALGAARPVSATSQVPKLSLASLNLTAGTYLITVQAAAGSQTSSMASATVTLVQANLNAIRVFPNPWRGDRHTSANITFDNLSTGAEIKIFTVSGQSVRTLMPSSSAPDSVAWDRKNDSGDAVASGIYIYSVKDSSGSKAKGKVVIIK